MGRLTSFINMSLDGYFSGPNGDFSWAHEGNDEEFNAFVADNARGGGALLMGRVTYDIMAAFWPTEAARATMPVVASQMNSMQKYVASRTMIDTDWQNTTILNGDLVAEVAALKRTLAEHMTILGSGSLIAQMTEARLIDEYGFVVNPVALGEGRTAFEHLGGRAAMRLKASRVFSNGKVFLSYERA